MTINQICKIFKTSALQPEFGTNFSPQALKMFTNFSSLEPPTNYTLVQYQPSLQQKKHATESTHLVPSPSLSCTLVTGCDVSKFMDSCADFSLPLLSDAEDPADGDALLPGAPATSGAGLVKW